MKAGAVLVFLAFLGACSRDDGSVVVSGDVPGLDTVATRGDSIIASAALTSARIDSMRAGTLPRVDTSKLSADARSPRTSTAGASAAGATRGAGLTNGDELQRRGLARGDSMARAAAQQFARTAGDTLRSRGDSARGIIRLVGAVPAVMAVLQQPNGTRVTLSGLATAGLTKLDGVEVVVRGVRVSPTDVVVADYHVRAVDGVPAYDGILMPLDQGYAIQLSDGSGRKRLSSVPPTLREASGSRVWVSIRDGSSVPTAYGLISRR